MSENLEIIAVISSGFRQDLVGAGGEGRSYKFANTQDCPDPENWSEFMMKTIIESSSLFEYGCFQ